MPTTLLFSGSVVFFVAHAWSLLTASTVLAEIIVPHHHEATEELRRFDDAVKKKKWAQALDSVNGLQMNHGAELVEITPGHFRNLTDVCQEKLSQAPPELLELWRQETDSQARPRWRRALSRRSQRALAQLAHTNYCSSYTGQALQLLSEIALDANDLRSAEYYSEQLQKSSLHRESSSPRLPEKADPLSVLRKITGLKKIWEQPLPGSATLKSIPVRCSELLCLIQGNKVFGYDLNSGGLPFEGVDPLNPVIYESFQHQGRNQLSKLHGLSRSQGAYSKGDLFAFLRGQSNQPIAVCLETEKTEGKLVWKNTAIELNAQALSPPLVFNEGVYVAVSGGERSNQIFVYCLDRLTGKVRWKSEVGTFVNNTKENARKPSQFQLRQTGAELSLLMTGQLVAQLDPFSGILREVKVLAASSQQSNNKIQLLWDDHLLEQEDQRLSLKQIFASQIKWTINLPTPAQVIVDCELEEALRAVVVLVSPDQVHWRNLQDGRLLHQVSLPSELKTRSPQKSESKLYLSGRYLFQVEREVVRVYKFE